MQYTTDHESYINKAKRLVENYVLEHGDHTVEVYVVWFAKTLENWKALVGTTKSDGRYYEVTYSGIRRQAYIDVYEKQDNQVVDDKIGDQDIQSEPMDRFKDSYMRKNEKVDNELLAPFQRELPSEDDQDVCTDPACTYSEPHKHGFACTLECHCNGYG
jgi:hypothetical protein